MAFTLAVLAGCLLIHSAVGQVCNPTININTGFDEDSNDTIQVTTEIQSEQTRELFQNVSEALLASYEERFRAFVSTLNISSRPKDCQDVFDQGSTQTGIYKIYPKGTQGFLVRCDMDGQWTVFQRRVSDSDFYKTWKEYQIGFGNLSENFWLGNQQIHMITSQGWYELMINMTHSNGVSKNASYNVFSIGDAASSYRLSVDGFHGNAGDSLAHHNGQRFSTRDRDNDASSSNCAVSYTGAWWYRGCHLSNLNGDYGNNAYAKGLTWHSFTGYHSSLTKSEMKIRRWSPPMTQSTSSASSGKSLK